MRGSNGEMVEHQKNHLHLCPVCLRKLHWSVGFDVPEHYAKLLDIFQPYEALNESFARDCAFLRQRLSVLEGLPPGATVTSELAAKPCNVRGQGAMTHHVIPKPAGVADVRACRGSAVSRQN